MAEKDVAKDVSIEENTVAKDIVVTKYKMAAEIVNGSYMSVSILRCRRCIFLEWKRDICVQACGGRVKIHGRYT